MSEKPILKLDWCSHKAAKYAVEHWHYSRSMPLPPVAKIGVWENGVFIGAILFSHGSCGVGSIGKGFNLESTAVAELGRVALSNHISPVTKIIKIAISMIVREFPGLRLIVSYADPEKGHIGGIYQGGNWIYIGRSSPDKAYIDKNGVRYHSRRISASGYKIIYGRKTACPSMSELTEVDVEPKYKYLMPLDDAMRKQIEPLRKPYPKRQPRGGSADSGTSDDQSEGGGANPTSSLLYTVMEQ